MDRIELNDALMREPSESRDEEILKMISNSNGNFTYEDGHEAEKTRDMLFLALSLSKDENIRKVYYRFQTSSDRARLLSAIKSDEMKIQMLIEGGLEDSDIIISSLRDEQMKKALLKCKKKVERLRNNPELVEDKFCKLTGKPYYEKDYFGQMSEIASIMFSKEVSEIQSEKDSCSKAKKLITTIKGKLGVKSQQEQEIANLKEQIKKQPMKSQQHGD